MRNMLKSFWLITFLILVILVLAVSAVQVYAQTPTPPSVGQANEPQLPDNLLLLVPILAGSIGVPLVNFLKGQFGWTQAADKVKNIWLTFGVSIVLAVIALLITDSLDPAPLFTDPTIVTAWLALTFTTATLIYKNITKPETTP